MMRFIDYLIEASSGVDMWDKYYKGRRVMTTIKPKGAQLYDANTNKAIPGKKLSGGHEVLVIGEYPLLPTPSPADMAPGSRYDLRVGATDPANAASKAYQQRGAPGNDPSFVDVEYSTRTKIAVYDDGHQSVYLVSVSDIAKPLQKKLFVSLKPQKVLEGRGKLENGFAVFSTIAAYKAELIAGIEQCSDLSKEVKAYLTALVIDGKNSTTIQPLYDQTGISNSVPSYNALNNDFLEMIGPFVAGKNGKVEIPLRDNEAMIDFKVGGAGFSSKRAATMANTLKCGDVIKALGGQKLNQHEFSYQLMSTLATATVKQAPAELTNLFNSSKFAAEIAQFASERVFKNKRSSWLPAKSDWSIEDNYNMQMTTIEKFVNQCVAQGAISFDKYVNEALMDVGVVKMQVSPRTGALDKITVTPPGSMSASKVGIRHKGRGFKGGERMGFVL
jgi:hypothetical protein